MTICPVCGNTVPEGEFCGACGAHLPTSSASRLSHFAANPSEHVLQPSIVSTLFPHLPHRATAPFRIALVVLGTLLFVLGVLRLTGPGIAVAAIGLPLLYALYIYETDMYRDEPVIVTLATFGVGLVLGIPWALFTGPIVTNSLIHSLTIGPQPRDIAGSGILIPVGALIVMMVGPIVLYFRWQSREPLDGFVFGAASALGFSLATTLIDLAPQLHNGLISGAPVVDNALAILSWGLLVPFLNAGNTGLLAAALWTSRRRGRENRPGAWTISPLLAGLVTAVVRVVVGLFSISVLSIGVVAGVLAALTLVLVLWVRAAVHVMLLMQPVDAQVGDNAICYGCHRSVPRMAFCPHCGLAIQATPRRIAPAGERTGTPGLYSPAGAHALHDMRKSVHRRHPWLLAGGITVASMLALGVTAMFTERSVAGPCHMLCRRPPPPCFGVSCSHATSALSVTGDTLYTSPTYGFSLAYPPDLPPTRSDNSSLGWDLQSSAGQYSVDVVSGATKGRSPQEIALGLQQNNFSDYQQVYDIPGAEIGYQSGYGSIWDLQVSPLFGQSEDTRLLIMASEHKGLALALVADGPAITPDSSHPDPSGLPLGSFADGLANSVAWPGASAH